MRLHKRENVDHTQRGPEVVSQQGERIKKILMNHSPRKANVGDRYSNADFDDLKMAIDDVSAFLLDKADAMATVLLLGARDPAR